ncbi:MAG: anti-sigma factor family protein [Planctomycetota bacterium]|jgi:hypothetical protein
MKENMDIDELLNGFIDGELTERQHTEAQRLIAHDAGVAQRLRELQSCKILVSSLPCAEAPAGMVAQIKASLERSAPIVQPPVRIEEVGARHLFARKVAAAAAMIGLVAVLAGVIYTIVAPENGTERPVAVEGWEQPARKFEMVKPSPATVAVAEKPIIRFSPAEMEFSGSLELKTRELVIVEASINRAIEDNQLLEKVAPKSQRNKRVYTLSCSREALGLLLADLDNIWKRVDSATLSVETDQLGEQIVVDAVVVEQVAEIIKQDSLEERIELARDFAVLNKMAELSPGREMFAAIDDTKPDLIAIPKPVLTSSEKAIKERPVQPEDDQRVHLTLTIVVVGSQ